MQVIKFQDETINATDRSATEWTEATTKDELMVEVFTSMVLFEDLSMYWKELQEKTESDIYMSYEWAYNWWKHFGKNKQRSLFIVTVWDGTRLVGIAPFYKGYSAFGKLKLETRLQIIGSGGNPNEQLGYMDDDCVSDYLDFVVDPSYKSVVADLLAEDVMTHSFLGVDVVKLKHIADDSFVMNYLAPRLQNKYPEMKKNRSATYSHITLYEQQLLQDHIENREPVARRRLRKAFFSEDREYTIEDVTGSREEVEQAAEEIIKLHQTRCNRLGLPGVFYDDRFIDFFKDFLQHAYENNWLWFKQAKDDEGICASRIALRYNSCYYDFVTGFDDRSPSSKFRPDLGLLIDLIRDGISKEVQQIKLPAGERDYIQKMGHNLRTQTLKISLRKKKRNIPWLLNRIGAFGHKYAMREKQLINIQRRKKGFFKMLWGYLRLRWRVFKFRILS